MNLLTMFMPMIAMNFSSFGWSGLTICCAAVFVVLSGVILNPSLGCDQKVARCACLFWFVVIFCLWSVIPFVVALSAKNKADSQIMTAVWMIVYALPLSILSYRIYKMFDVVDGCHSAVKSESVDKEFGDKLSNAVWRKYICLYIVALLLALPTILVLALSV